DAVERILVSLSGAQAFAIDGRVLVSGPHKFSIAFCQGTCLSLHWSATLRFVGNVNADGVVHHKLSHSIRSRFLRFVPLDWNPSGWVGLRVEVYGCAYKSYVADFDGRSSLLYRFNQKSMSTVKDVISLSFKSRQAEGVLLHGEGQRGDYITLE
uniref:F5/8 type C domain-containing protein n=1 Tax=Hucho hucho TaxID=62062 RepID=A0A4W5KSC9_9TELE